jgi:hypothetical protein
LLAAVGLTVVGEELNRPWGGFLLISQSEVREFRGCPVRRRSFWWRLV